MSTTSVIASASRTTSALCLDFTSGSHTPATSHKHAAVATYFATPTAAAYYATAHKATAKANWQKSGTGSSLGV